MALGAVREAIYEWIANIDSPVETSPMEKRFQKFVSEPDENGCQMWEGSIGSGGYGIFTIKGVQVYAHRIALRLSGVAIPERMTVDHDRSKGCSTNRACVNPDHLTIVSRGENARRTRNLNVFT